MRRDKGAIEGQGGNRQRQVQDRESHSLFSFLTPFSTMEGSVKKGSGGGKEIYRYVQLVTLQASLAAGPPYLTPLLQWSYRSGLNHTWQVTLTASFLLFCLNPIATARMQSRSWLPRVSSSRHLRSILSPRVLRFRITCCKRPVNAYVILPDFCDVTVTTPQSGSVQFS